MARFTLSTESDQSFPFIGDRKFDALSILPPLVNNKSQMPHHGGTHGEDVVVAATVILQNHQYNIG